MTELESNILTTQTQEVMEISICNFGWAGENIQLQPRMAAVARREAIRSHPMSPTPLISTTVVGCMEGIHPTFRATVDLGQGIAQISATTTQQLQPCCFRMGVNSVFVGIQSFSMHTGTTMGGGGVRPTSIVQGGGGSGIKGGMHGNPPTIFTGNCFKSNKFLEDFKVY